MNIVNPAATGRVNNQETMMFLMTLKLIALIPFAIPIPITVPTETCVVETGIPTREQRSTTVAAENSAAKPRVGVT